MKILPITGRLGSVLVCTVFLSGCWDQIEGEELAFVTVVGLDRAEDEENMVEITYVIANPEAGTQAGGGGATNEPPIETISFTAEDFNTAKSIANTVVAKRISYDLLRVFMVSEEFASDDDFIRWIYDITKAPEVRRDINLLVTKEAPSTFVNNNQPKLDTRSHKFYEYMFKNGQETGTLPPSQLNQFFRITEANADLFLGFYGTTEHVEGNARKRDSDQFIAGELNYEGQANTAEFAGSAVFDEGKMVGTLTVEETRLSYLLNNALKQPESIIVALPDPTNEEHQIAVRLIRHGKVQFDMNLKGSNSSIHATVPISMDVLTNHNMTDIANDENAREDLKRSFEDTFDQKFADLVKKTQEELGGQPFSWSLAARKEFLTLPEFVAFDFKEKYPEMDVTVKTEITFNSFGRQTELPELEEVRD